MEGFKATELRTGDLVQILTGLHKGQRYLVVEADGSDTLYVHPATKAGNKDRRYDVGWTGRFTDDLFALLSRDSN